MVVLLFLFSVYASWGQDTSTLYINASSITDEFGNLIQAGPTPEESPLVQVLDLSTPDHLPPHVDGNPQEDVLAEPYIGKAVDPSFLGAFSESVIPPNLPPTNTIIGVRVYNAPTVSNSLFYANSTNTMIVTGYEAAHALRAWMGPMTNKLYPNRDTDLDGIPDWYEHLHAEGNHTGLVATATVPDKDTTWMEEYIIGSDPNDPSDRFVIVTLEPLYSETNYVEHVWTDPDTGIIYTQNMYAVEGEILSWPSVQGREYDVIYRTNLITGSVAVLDGATNLPATPPANIFTNKTLIEDGTRLFYRARVRLVEE